jgi:hypothetical protein
MDWPFFVLIGGGAAFLVGAMVQSRRAREKRARLLGHQAYGDISHLPRALQDTVLWSVTEGGREREVTAADVRIADTDAEATTFVLEPLRELRAEWGYVPLDPPFRVKGPIAVAVIAVDRELPRLLARRAGPSDAMRELLTEKKALGAPLRRLSGIPSSLPADLPDALTVPTVPLAEDWRGVASSAAAPVLTAIPGLVEAKSRGLDLMVESCGTLVIACDISGDLPADDGFKALVDVASTVADALLGVAG